MLAQDRLFCEIAVQLELLTRDQASECMRTMARDKGAQSIGAIATGLGFLTPAQVDEVLTHLQRVLERRRQIRATNQGQREAEARAARALRARASQAAAAPPKPEPLPVRKHDPTPTAPWKHAHPEPGLSPSQPAMPAVVVPTPDPDADSGPGTPSRRPVPTQLEARPGAAGPGAPVFGPGGTLVGAHDPQTAAYGGGDAFAAQAAELSAARADAAASLQLLAPGDHEPPRASLFPPAARGSTPPPRASVPPRLSNTPLAQPRVSSTPLAQPRISSTPLAQPRISTTPPAPAHAVPGHAPASSTPPFAGHDQVRMPSVRPGAPQASQPPAARASQPPPHSAPEGAYARPSQPPPRGAPEGAYARPSQPPPRNAPEYARASQPPPEAASAARASLPPTPGRSDAAQLQAAALRASAARRFARPVPSGRDWRNPSHPPPPTAALDLDPILVHVAHADTLALPANDTPRGLRAPAIDAPRYLDAALRMAVEAGGSDLHVHSGAPLSVRIDGRLWPLTGDETLTRAAAERVIGEVLDDAQRSQLSLEGELRFAYDLPEIGRFRAHVYTQERGTDVVFRLLTPIVAPENLGLGAALRTLREQPPGLCVCSGPAGSGKTTSLAALAQAFANERALHVVTVEDPIELLHGPCLGVIEQRELGRHVASYSEGIELAQRQAADVIVVSDLSAPGVLDASLRAARGHGWVLGGLRASSSAQALSKLLASDATRAESLRLRLAHGLRLLLHQRLMPRAKASGRILALESLLNTPQVAQLIREDKLQQLPAVMAAGRSSGMIAMDDALDELVRAGAITIEAARRAAHRRERFKAA